MNIIFLLYIVLVSKLCFSKPYYSGPGYNNERESDSSAMASSHQKKRLLSDESSQMQEASGIYDAPSKYRKYQPPADYMHRDSRLDHDQSDFETEGKERQQFYDNSNAAAKDSSIEVILDPRAKKAVAVVEKSPSGQAMYDLSGWKSGAENQENSEQVVNLVYPAERSSIDKLQRKYNSDNYDANSNSDYSAPVASSNLGMRERAADSNDQIAKKKRSAETSKSENSAIDNNKNAVKRSVVTDKRKADVLSKADEKQNDCPPHNTPQSTETKNLLEAKRETHQQWSQEQITALHNSVLKANDDTSEMSNLRAMLTEMGLSENNLKRDANEKDIEKETNKIIEAKREVPSADFNEDETANQDSSALSRNDRALSDDENWEIDVNSAPEEPIEKRTVTDDKENIENKSNDEASASIEDLEADTLERKKRQNIDKNENINTKLVTNEPDKKLNKRELDDNKKEKRKIDDASNYDQQMENQIQAKIDAIKEKVKRDLVEDQKRKRAKRFTDSEDDDKSSSSKTNSRKKRANMMQEKQMIYRPFQADQDEETELDGDFDDNKLYLQKRQAADDDWQYFDTRGREYSPYLQSYYPQARSRRSFDADYVEDNAQFHDGGMSNNKLIKTREKLRDSFEDQDSSNTNANMNEINDSEYFGSLPLSYNGELTRYKRVKRDNPYK